MPAYFYHLTLEIFRDPTSTSLTLESAHEALRPFQRLEPSSSGIAASSSASASGKSLTLEHRPRHTSKPSSTSPPQEPTNPHPQTQALDPAADIRFNEISIQCIDMVAPEAQSKKRSKGQPHEEDNLVAAGIGTDILGGLRTKGRYIPLDQKVSESVWGIVHLYRDAQESGYLAEKEDDYSTYLKGSAAAVSRGENSSTQSALVASASKATGRSRAGGKGEGTGYPFPTTASMREARDREDDCTTLCILAVPAYLSPSDFLGFIGEKTLDDVCHFRMIRTSRANRYMVLMKFRSGRKAKEWQKEWNGKVFNSMEPETCHVVFVHSVEIQVSEPESPSTFSDHGLTSPSTGPRHSVSNQAPLSSKPLAPPTPALIELPTCPVCLERMDETTGLLTIICQHVFHCTCLQKWKGSGCPVCRYTQDDFRKGTLSLDASDDPAECSTCHNDLNLWACLICGNVGCGRYDGAHAFEHWKETAHAFAMDLNSQRVWDYVGDAYVHRIIQSKTDGKLVELPGADHSALDPPDMEDAVPREKLENMSVEYTHLLTSQLESQRAYFEEIVERAADKASQASAAALAAESAAEKAMTRLEEMQSKYEVLSSETIPGLERDRARLEKRAEKFEALARKMEKEYREEKSMNQNLLEKVEMLGKENGELKLSKADLEDQNRDLSFFISSSQQLAGQGEDVVQGTVSVPEAEVKKRRNKGKGRK
ncbi:hypothetical protein N7532_008929 [Penicillium argentinense]|uniref:Uncharacterized protein n=1 Tax=Penicillium argentinense TaxID=1131581 RepID=A0A9W9EYL6_9EURO|nr:uncharacterized protein N7532_008929 [Penicillium argentinense]KAJ5090245.1 hypothetical protein N7532_008929 [Penicillium argentinense]